MVREGKENKCKARRFVPLLFLAKKTGKISGEGGCEMLGMGRGEGEKDMGAKKGPAHSMITFGESHRCWGGGSKRLRPAEWVRGSGRTQLNCSAMGGKKKKQDRHPFGFCVIGIVRASLMQVREGKSSLQPLESKRWGKKPEETPGER